ncbi:MAG: hydantoinase B/oxoprolinase family protein [Thalassobaculum sp.]|uniref:hydantoinase B/oxoprolinase family protein n=1 Tax=Thalassobaculum sp. TaxID=2022740 RepID=UPI0032EE9BA0
MAIDPVTLEILKNHCRAAAESMAFTLYRTAHSTFVKETEDFTTGLTTPEGLTFATPTELGATWFVGLNYGNVIKAIDHYDEGDIGMTNDPYSGYVCTHSPDMHIWKPVFHDGEIVCFVVGHIHNTDVGGAVPASLSRTLSEVHQEGIRIPPTKIVRRGEINQEILNVLLANVRMPEQNWGDLKAQIASVNTGERRVHEMIAKFGVETFREGIAGLLDYAEAQARDIVRELPDGRYFFADYLDEDVAGGYPCRIALTLDIHGDGCTFDFTGSDPQIEGSVNMPTGGAERHALMMVGLVYVLYSLNPRLFLNSGVCRVCTCIMPDGTIVNPRFPAAVGLRTLSVQRLQGVIIGAFSQAAQDRLPAGPASGGPIMNVNTIDNRTGRRVVASIDPITGGAGGNPREDGTEGSGANSSFLKNTPVEINEAEVPIKILRYGLARDSGGPGKHRGGMATELRFEAQAPNTRITARNRDRSRFTSWGMLGGRAGSQSRFLLNPGTDREENLGNTDILKIGPGDVVHIGSGGAGGWGDPLERDPEAVLTDVKRHMVSAGSAERDYGVVIAGGTVEAAATAVLRARLAAGRAEGGFFDFGPERTAYEAVWTAGNYAALTELLAGLPVHWRFFVKHRIFEAVDALPPERRRGDGSEVRDGYAQVVGRYPQLAALL